MLSTIILIPQIQTRKFAILRSNRELLKYEIGYCLYYIACKSNKKSSSLSPEATNMVMLTRSGSKLINAQYHTTLAFFLMNNVVEAIKRVRFELTMNNPNNVTYL